nr:maturase, mitochondrial [Tanacetum cinerariifolium]
MMGEMTFFLGLQVNQSPCGIFFKPDQNGAEKGPYSVPHSVLLSALPDNIYHVVEILKKYGMESCDPVGTPMEIKDKLYLDQNETPVDATKYHSMIGALTSLVYKGFWFELIGFSDADYAGCKDTFKSTSCGAQFLSEKLDSWSSKKQDCMTLSTAKEEYVSLSACCAQVLWMRTQLTDYGFHFKKIPIYCDSKSAIAISCNLRIRSVLLRTGRIDDQEDSGEEASFNPPQDNRAIIVGRVKSIQRKAAFHSLVSSWHTPPTSTPRLRGDQYYY